MNENEMNVQNIGNNQPINPNAGMQQPNSVNIGVMPEQQPQNIGVVQQPQVQSMPNSQTASSQENINMVVPQNPIPSAPVGAPMNNGNIPPTNHIMEDFSQAVVSEPVVPTVNVAPTMSEVAPKNPTQNPVINNVSVESQPEVATIPVQENVDSVVASNNATITPIPTETTVEMPTQVEETNPTSTAVAEESSKKKKKGNWAFIIALFAVVGFFVLLLPLLVRIFGY